MPRILIPKQVEPSYLNKPTINSHFNPEVSCFLLNPSTPVVKHLKSARISMNTTVLLDSNSKEKVSMSADKSIVLADGQQIRKIAKTFH